MLEGRRTFGNIMKYIMMGTSSNFGNMFSMAGASLFLPFLPMLPMQILLNNLLYDVSELPIPLDRVDDDYLSHPRRWDMDFIRNFMLVIGPVSSLFDFLTFYIMLARVPRRRDAVPHRLVHRIDRHPGAGHLHRPHPQESVPQPPRPVAGGCSLAVVAAAALLPFTPAAAHLGFVAPPALFFLTLGATLLLYLCCGGSDEAMVLPAPRGGAPMMPGAQHRERVQARLPALTPASA